MHVSLLLISAKEKSTLTNKLHLSSGIIGLYVQRFSLILVILIQAVVSPVVMTYNCVLQLPEVVRRVLIRGS